VPSLPFCRTFVFTSAVKIESHVVDSKCQIVEIACRTHLYFTFLEHPNLGCRNRLPD
jgi:hypothetical protein